MMLRWLCLVSVCLMDALGLDELYQLYGFLAELDAPDDDLP